MCEWKKRGGGSPSDLFQSEPYSDPGSGFLNYGTGSNLNLTWYRIISGILLTENFHLKLIFGRYLKVRTQYCNFTLLFNIKVFSQKNKVGLSRDFGQDYTISGSESVFFPDPDPVFFRIQIQVAKSSG